MTKHERAKLKAEMRRLISEMLKSEGRVTTHDIYARAIQDLPDIIESAKERLFRQSLTQMARNILKEAMAQKDKSDGVMQISLFGNSAPEMEVPKCIAVPAGNGSNEMVWTPTLDASLSELEAHIKYLQKSAAADVAKARKLKAFHERVLDMLNTDDMDTPISDLLSGLQEKTA